MEMANPLLESFGEPQKPAYLTNFSRPLANLITSKKKETQICHPNVAQFVF